MLLTSLRCRGVPGRGRAGGGPGGASRLSKRVTEAVTEERARHPGAAVELWAFDEPRAGLKPVLRRVWAKRGRRPVAVVAPGYEWLYLYDFVRPATGDLVWFLGNTVNTALFAAVLARFAAAVGAGPDKRIILVLDGAGWHGARGGVAVPEGVCLEFLPPYSPELQPAEHLWPLTNESIANQPFANLAELDAALADQPEIIKAHTRFHGWPQAA
jgi:hypothetical protein